MVRYSGVQLSLVDVAALPAPIRQRIYSEHPDARETVEHLVATTERLRRSRRPWLRK